MDRLEGPQDVLSAPLPPNHECPLSSSPEGSGEEEEQSDVDVVSLCTSHTVLDNTLSSNVLREGFHFSSAEPADSSTGVSEAPVSSVTSRVLNAAKVLGLQVPVPVPVPV